MNKNIAKLLLIILIASTFSGCSLNIKQTNNSSNNKQQLTSLDSSHGLSEETINLIAYNFFFSQSEIVFKKGQNVNIDLYSADGQHDIYIEGYNIQSTVVDTNNKTNLKFTADKAGEFAFYSSVGNQKELGLSGKIIVVE